MKSSYNIWLENCVGLETYVYMDVTWNNLTDKGLDFIRRWIGSWDSSFILSILIWRAKLAFSHIRMPWTSYSCCLGLWVALVMARWPHSLCSFSAVWSNDFSGAGFGIPNEVVDKVCEVFNGRLISFSWTI